MTMLGPKCKPKHKIKEKIRKTLFTHEPVSALKALLSIQQNNQIISHYKLNRDSKSTIMDAGLRIINKKALYNYINSNNSSISKISFEDNKRVRVVRVATYVRKSYKSK